MSTRFTFYLDWVICAQFAGQYWAQATGLYAQAGLDVALMPWHEDGRSIIDKVRDGGVCAGCCEDNLVVSAVSKRQPVKIIGAMLQETPLVLMSRPEKAIRSFQDLRGKRIGMHADGNRALEIVLALEGIAPHEIAIHEVGFDLEHLGQDRVDAQQGYAMTEPIQLAGLGLDVDMLAVKHPHFQPYAQAYVATTAMIETHADVLRAFLRASHDGWRAVLADPDQAANIIAEALGDRARANEQRKMLDRLLPLVAGALPHSQIGAIALGQWQRNLATYAAHGLVDPALTLADLIDVSFQPI
jgi:NitT/TauT family transport system substrate-binding protein